MLDDFDELERLRQFKASRGLTSTPSVDCACRVSSERRGYHKSANYIGGCRPPRKFGDHPYGFRNVQTLEPILTCSPYYQTLEELYEIRQQAREWADKWGVGVWFEDESFYQGEGDLGELRTTLIVFYRKTPLSTGEKNRVLRRRKRGKRLTVSAE